MDLSNRFDTSPIFRRLNRETSIGIGACHRSSKLASLKINPHQSDARYLGE
jgi:hypothetical protein